MWYGFVQAPHDALDMIGQAIFALLALGVIILASRRVRTDQSVLGVPTSIRNAPLDSASDQHQAESTGTSPSRLS
jgi:hypothetical protein